LDIELRNLDRGDAGDLFGLALFNVERHIRLLGRLFSRGRLDEFDVAAGADARRLVVVT
jgi:hypothetical protein